MEYLKIKNWDKFQHYKDRNPPWIKLYNSLLYDYEFSCLQDASKLHLILIWLLASEIGNKIPIDEKYLTKALNLDHQIDLQPLISLGFLIPYNECLHDASNMLARCLQDARPETETEVDKEKEKANPPNPPFWGESETFFVSDGGDSQIQNDNSASIRKELHESARDRDKKTPLLSKEIHLEIWNAYPSIRRGGKPHIDRALRRIEKLVDLSAVLSAVREYVASPYVQSRLKTPDVDKIPLLSTWLNDERWNQDRAAWQIPRVVNGQRASPIEECLSEEAKRNIKRTIGGIIKKFREENRESEIPEQIRNHLEKLKMTQEEFEDECRTRIAAQSRSREESSGSLFSSDDSSKS